VKIDCGLNPADLKGAGAHAQAAEAAGFDAIWSAETAHDPFFPLLLAAQKTDRIKLGTGIAVAFPRSPMIMAHIAWDLANYSNGRFILGLGTQIKAHNEKRFSVPYDKPGPKLRDMILALRAIWDCWQNGTKLRYEGEYLRHTLMTPFFNPGPIDHPEIPIYVAGVNPYICQMVGELCQGFMTHPFHSIKYLQEVVFPNIKKGTDKAGRSLDDIDVHSSAFVIIGDNEDEQRAAAVPVRTQIAFYASTPAYYPVLEAHGWGDVGPKLNAESKKGNWTGMAELITDEMLDVYAVRGTRESIAENVVKRYKGTLDRVMFYFGYSPGSDDAQWRKYIDTIHAEAV